MQKPYGIFKILQSQKRIHSFRGNYLFAEIWYLENLRDQNFLHCPHCFLWACRPCTEWIGHSQIDQIVAIKYRSSCWFFSWEISWKLRVHRIWKCGSKSFQLQYSKISLISYFWIGIKLCWQKLGTILENVYKKW